MKNILNEVISKLKSEKDGYCRITHKKGWLGFLADGDLVFKPHDLHQALRQTIDTEGMRPKGDRLFFLRSRYNLTVTIKNKPYRTEEALERFITASNQENFSNQIPIGGGKESIDIGIQENDSSFVFIELKPWSSVNSPLYAIVESLKNLIEYWIIIEKEIKEILNFKAVELMVLAPESYYQEYGLIDRTGLHKADKIRIVKKALNDFSAEFDTNISLMVLPIKKDVFLNICQRVCGKYKQTTGQEIIHISRADSIPELARSQWELLVSANRDSNR